MPLVDTDAGTIEEQPLSRIIFHAGLDELDLHGVERVPNHFGDLCGPSRSNFTVDSLQQIQGAGEKLPSPSFVADAVLPERFPRERRIRIYRIAHEAAGGMGVHAEKKGYKQVMRVPERFERLSANVAVCGGVHEKHAKQHNVACYASRLCVVDLDGGLGPDL